MKYEPFYERESSWIAYTFLCPVHGQINSYRPSCPFCMPEDYALKVPRDDSVDLSAFTVGSTWYVMGDAQDEVTVLKTCKKMVKVEGYQYERPKLFYPRHLYLQPCTPQILIDIAQRQAQLMARKKTRT